MSADHISFNSTSCPNDPLLVFLVSNALPGSRRMRGELTSMVIDMFRAHGLTSVHTAVYRGREEELDSYLRSQPRRIGACVMVKFDQPRAVQTCRTHNSTVVLDCIDNPRCFAKANLKGMMAYDRVLVQTSVHRDWLRSHKIHSDLFSPHPHGHVGLPLPPPHVRAVPESAAFLYSDPANLPSKKSSACALPWGGGSRHEPACGTVPIC
eukprot:scaffold19515_cov114-Isochrysis_galbana.AAC.4